MEDKNKRFTNDITWFLFEDKVKEKIFEFGPENNLSKITKFEVVKVARNYLPSERRAFENFTLFQSDIYKYKIYRDAKSNTFYIDHCNGTYTITKDFIDYKYNSESLYFGNYHRVITRSVIINSNSGINSNIIRDSTLYGRLYTALANYIEGNCDVISLMAEGKNILIRQVLDAFKGECWYLINFGDLYQAVIKHKK